tara:strand:+ start:102 stop:314 length:213 start_codon:yes stop_codon:yes gene_type:complete
MITEVTILDLTLDIEYEFTKQEISTNDYQGSSAKVDLYNVHLDSYDIYDIIDLATTEKIKDLIIEQHENI